MFGKHQSSEERYNIFSPSSYEEKIPWKELMKNPEELKGTVDLITYFGQCPTKLFTKEHRPKLHIEDIKREVRTRAESQSHTTNSNSCPEEVQIPPEWKVSSVNYSSNKFHLGFEDSGGKG